MKGWKWCPHLWEKSFNMDAWCCIQIGCRAWVRGQDYCLHYNSCGRRHSLTKIWKLAGRTRLPSWPA